MPIPDFQSLMLPVLQFLDSVDEAKSPAIRQALADQFQLTTAELEQLIPSKRQGLFHNRVAWALAYLKQAALVESPARSTYRITASGKELVKAPPERITIKYLSRYPEFETFRSRTQRTSDEEGGSSDGTVSKTPEEILNDAHASLESALASELLALLNQIDPYRFEQIVVDLLFAMGYGGSRAEAAEVTKKSNDEGIDGIINQDRLGLDVVYVQAKRWQNTVGRREIQAFVGALAGKQANKGIFITTSDYANSAIEYANTVSQKVILIDGRRLADLMIEHNVGCTVQDTLHVKKIDADYFEG